MAVAAFRQEVLLYHNLYRSKHSTPPLTLSDELNASAQKWAEHMLKANTWASSAIWRRENLFHLTSTSPLKLTGKEAVKVWYKTNQNYNWSDPGFNSTTATFTRVVWKATTELGVGMATDGKKIYVVAHYDPAYNGMGDYQANVLPLVPKFQLDFLDAHNEYRSKHNTPPLILNMELTASAQKWADHLLETKKVAYRVMENGESITQYFIPVTGNGVVERWYSEWFHYGWGNPESTFDNAKFTQVVWKETTDLGVGMATDGKRFIVVGEYRPKGNISGRFHSNVLRRAS